MEQFKLMELPYAMDALEPVISKQTLSFHHGKHLQTYVNNLNAALPESGFEGKLLEEIVCVATGGIFNNAGQILNHNLYFEALQTPKADNSPTGKIAAALEVQFGGFDTFKDLFTQKGASLFGSGWLWLSSDHKGQLHITQETNAGNPVTQGLRPLLTFDVWEHAYYLDWQNRRADHLHAMWQLVNWEVVENRYKTVKDFI